MRRPKFEALDALRGAASISVLLWHCDIPHQDRFWIAGLSVDLFFVLSGFVIAHAYENRLKQGWPPGRFLVARVIRLWPVYLVGTAIGAAGIATWIGYFGLQSGLRYLLFCLGLSLFLLPQMIRGYDTAFPLNGPAWSLFIEFVVNAAYALGAFRLSTRSLMAVAGISWCLFVFLTFYPHPPFFKAAGILLAFPEGIVTFTTGVILRRCWAAGRLPRFAMNAAWLVVLLVGLLIAAAQIGDGRYAQLLAVSLFWPLLVAIGVSSDLTGPIGEVLKHSGRLSYPLYATHAGFYIFANMLYDEGVLPHWLAFGGAVVLALVFADLVECYYDRPVRAWLANGWKTFVERSDRCGELCRVRGRPATCSGCDRALTAGQCCTAGRKSAECPSPLSTNGTGRVGGA